MKTLVGFGASSMQGVGDSQGGFLKRVAAHCQSHDLPVTVISKGIGGQSTPDMLARIDELAPLRPYELVFILGCNDLPRARDQNLSNRTAPDIYAANVHRIFSTIKGDRSLFISSFAVSEERTGVSPSLFANYMGAATAIARSHGYDLWDLFNETKGRTEPRLADDGLHFNDAGHVFIANRVLEWLGPGLPRADEQGLRPV